LYIHTVLGKVNVLTPKQEAFCHAYIETSNASEAYRRAYNAEKMKPSTINRMAHDVLENRNVSARLAELRASHCERHNITTDVLIAELDEARKAALAAESPQTAAAISATMGKAKLLGLDKPKPTVFPLKMNNLSNVATSIVQAIANGTLQPEHGTNLLDSIIKLTKIKEATETEQRISELETLFSEERK
jgi:phage terminase small subunit